jgi:peptidoglycan hydrolase CwlO-like protein
MKFLILSIFLFVITIYISFKHRGVVEEKFHDDNVTDGRFDSFRDVVEQRLDHNDKRFNEIVERQKEIMGVIDKMNETIGELNMDF